MEIELSHLDEKFRNLATIQNDYLALLEPGNQYDLKVEWFTRIDKEVFTVREKIQHLISSSRSKKSKGSYLSKFSSRSSKSNVVSAQQRAIEEKAHIAELLAESAFLEDKRAAEEAAERVRVKQEIATKARARIRIFEIFVILV